MGAGMRGRIRTRRRARLPDIASSDVGYSPALLVSAESETKTGAESKDECSCLPCCRSTRALSKRGALEVGSWVLMKTGCAAGADLRFPTFRPLTFCVL
jgi:hypothetical protein